MGRRRVTLADVAAASGVSPTTASLVLSGRGDELRISDSVQERVREVSSSLGYRPNILSRGLRQGASLSLGFVSDTVATSQLAGDLIKGALEAAHERGLMLFIGETEGDPEVERRLVRTLLDRQVDGLIVASMFTQHRELPPELEEAPTALLNTVAVEPRPGIDSVVPDELEAGRAATRLLLEAGHRRIHLVGTGASQDEVPPGTIAGQERLRGILEVLDEAGLRPESGHLCTAWLPPDGFRATSRIIEQGGAGSALITMNDRLAFGAYQALHERGLGVPHDMSIVSFDDAPLAEWLRPGLTTFAIPHYDLGRRAVDLVLDAVAARRSGATPLPASTHRLPMPLRSRGSVGPPLGAATPHA